MEIARLTKAETIRSIYEELTSGYFTGTVVELSDIDCRFEGGVDKMLVCAAMEYTNFDKLYIAADGAYISVPRCLDTVPPTGH